MSLRNQSSDIEVLQDDIKSINVVEMILSYIVRGMLFSVGLFLQIKIIAICRKERDKTWQITIAHSIASIILFSWAIIFLPISAICPVLSNHTGVSLCYIAAFMFVYFPYLLACHSLIVSFTKYVFIVHREKALTFGEEQLKKSILGFYLIHPFLLSIATISLYDFEAFESIIACFGLKEKLVQRYNTSTGNLERMFLCKLRWDGTEEGHFSYLFAQGFCATKMVYILILSSNIPEVYFYYNIFKKMKR